MFQQKRELVFPSVHFKLLILTCSIDTRSLITWRIPASGCRAWNPYWFEPASGVLSPPIPWHKHNHSLPSLLCRSGDVCHGDAVRLCARPLSDLVRSPPLCDRWSLSYGLTAWLRSSLTAAWRSRWRWVTNKYRHAHTRRAPPSLSTRRVLWRKLV